MIIREFEKYMPTLLKMKDPFVLFSEPGVGKSGIIASIAKSLGWDVLWFHPVVQDPTDNKGMPFAFMQDGQPRAKFLPFNDLELLIKADRPTLACYDDMGQAPLAVQASMMQLWLARRINGHAISDDVVFCGASNRAEDKSGVVGIMEALKGRATLIPIEADIDDFCKWSHQQDWFPEMVPAFLRFKTDLLSAFKPTRDLANTPTPRNWERLARKVSNGITNLELLSGDVGEAAAAEFLSFMEVASEMPNPDDCLANPETAPVPDKSKPSVLYALVGSLAHRAKPSTAEGLVTYLARIPAEFGVMCMKDALFRTNKDTKFRNTGAVTKWCVNNAELMSAAH